MLVAGLAIATLGFFALTDGPVYKPDDAILDDAAAVYGCTIERIAHGEIRPICPATQDGERSATALRALYE
jgi:hypothetical protein